jgi:hypothetical protein
MANTQINITENGTKTLATAGKYCDRNIDVNVNVAPKPTQFTNLYDPANVHLKQVNNCSSANGYQVTTDNYCNFVVIPYHHKANEPMVLRIRGIGTVRDRANFTLMKADGVTPESWGQFHNVVTLSYDEYGDTTLTCNGVVLIREWYYLHLNFQYTGVNSSASTAFTGPIITINEPIGNGGYAG